MNKTLIFAFAAATLAAAPAFAADSSSGSSTTTKPEMKTEGQMNPTAGTDGGVQPKQQPGAPTSNRSNEPTAVPSNQTDTAPSGETSDRTPEKHTK
jgi:hypothetical protein